MAAPHKAPLGKIPLGDAARRAVDGWDPPCFWGILLALVRRSPALHRTQCGASVVAVRFRAFFSPAAGNASRYFFNNLVPFATKD
jgi:hypothetical protein